MRNHRPYAARQIGFMLGGTPANPLQPNPMMTPPTTRTPFAGGSPPPMFGTPVQPPPGGMMGQQPGGLGGLLQGLLGGGGNLDLPGLLANAQKMIGAINQAGEIFKNISPMLQLIRSIDLSELLSDSDTPSDDEVEVAVEQKKPKRRRNVQKRKRTHAKKRKKSVS